MRLHRGIASALQIFMITGLVMSIPPVGTAAEIWPDSRAMLPDGLAVRGSSECKFITHDCETCITPVGSGMVKCSMLSEQCTPTEWACFEGIGNSIEGTRRRLVYAQTYANTPEDAGTAALKLFNDRLAEPEIVDIQKSARGNLGKPAIQPPTGLPSVKIYHDRLKIGD